MASKSEELEERRRKLCGLIYRGIPLNTASKNLAQTYDVKSETVKEDWYRRKEWLPELFDLEFEEAETALMDILAEEKEIKKELWKMFRRNSNPNVKMGVLKQVRSSNHSIIDVLKDLGIIEKDGGINIAIQNQNTTMTVEEEAESVVEEIEKYRQVIRHKEDSGGS